MEKIEILYKDKQDWTRAIDGIVTDWTNYSKKIKDSRIIPHYVANELLFDTWNGVEFSLQDVLWESFSFEFTLQEFEVLELNRLRSCSDIKIKKYSRNSSDVLIEKEYILDTTKSDNIDISEPERISDTSLFKINIIFRTNRTIIDKGGAVDNTNNIIVNSVTYYSDFDILTWNKDTEDLNVEWDDGTTKLFQTINKTGLQILLYFNNSDLETFLGNLKLSSTTTINSTTITEIEQEITPIGKDYYKVIIKGVDTTTVTTRDLNASQTYKLEIVDQDSTTHNFYTDYKPVLADTPPVIDGATNTGAIQKNSRSITREVKKATFYYNEINAFELKKRFELGGIIKFGLTASFPTVDTVQTWQAVAVGEPIGVDVYKVEIDLVIDTTKSYLS